MNLSPAATIVLTRAAERPDRRLEFHRKLPTAARHKMIDALLRDGLIAETKGDYRLGDGSLLIESTATGLMLTTLALTNTGLRALNLDPPGTGATGAPTATSNAAVAQEARRHRGVSEQTAELRRRMLTKLLPALGSAPESYAVGPIRQVILDQALQRSRGFLKNMAGALRGYLRFLVAGGRCSPGLEHAVPTFPEWQLSTLPRYLPAPEVERLISSCDVTNACGIRDRAVLLFLARLGLRAGGIVALRLDDIAWNEGTIRLAGKTRRQTRLPLPQDVGDALHEYISRVRLPINSDQVFLSVRPEGSWVI